MTDIRLTLFRKAEEVVQDTVVLVVGATSIKILSIELDQYTTGKHW